MKSKDDNMILLTSNLLLDLLEELTYDRKVFENNMEKVITLLQLDPSLRFITCLKLTKVFYVLYTIYISKENNLNKNQ